ncbi:MAG: saccharopine dehydrogenase NADP-binding domain-containing protein [Nitriliruptorales bacterium]|nr:saccharopine dehydrogenase NADP-binding domain-containing protein [Nitriliruptorales bacterium]
MPSAAPTDVVVFGATSFVGRLLCRYLADRHGFVGDGPEGLTWAVAARSRAKLDRLISELGDGAKALDVLVADALDEHDVSRLTGSARVVVTTVGPYTLYGSGLVAACAEAGTDYLDLAGETPWLRRMIDAHQAPAEASGARLVPCSGFDAIPSDMGVRVLQQAAAERFGAPATRVRMAVKAMRGGASGGTLASILNAVDEVRSDPDARKQLGNPYALCPEGHRSGVRQPEVMRPQHDAVFDRWLAPFVMSALNTRVVHRTNALLDYPYGEDFRYDEAMMTGGGTAGIAGAAGVTLGLAAFMGAAATPGLNKLLPKVLPDPGEGPSPEARRKGFWDFRFWGETGAGERLTAQVTGDRDPGYASTAKMLGEATACLALDVPARDEQIGGGFWTPASLLGDDLINRLETHAGVTFSVE